LQSESLVGVAAPGSGGTSASDGKTEEDGDEQEEDSDDKPEDNCSDRRTTAPDETIFEQYADALLLALDAQLAKIPDGVSIDYTVNRGHRNLGFFLNFSFSNDGVWLSTGGGWGIGNGRSATINRNHGNLTDNWGVGYQFSGNGSLTGKFGPGASGTLTLATNGNQLSYGVGVGLGNGGTATVGFNGPIHESCGGQ
jgi:hypothetical protein